MKRISLTYLLVLCFCSPLWAADVIGLSLPLKGRYAPVTERMEFGALQAVEELRKQGRDITLVTVDDGCDEKQIATTANKFLEARAKIVVGPVCFDFAAKLAKALNTEDGSTPTVPVIASNTRNKLITRLLEVDDLPLYALSSAADAEARAVVEQIIPTFGSRPFAILDDGSVYGRALSDEIRLIGEELGARPIESTNFRPLQTSQIALLRRLQKSGIEALFIAASPEDVVTIATDMRTLGLNWPIGTGERGALLPYIATDPSVLNNLTMVSERMTETDRHVMQGQALIEIAARALQTETPKLEKTVFETVFGPIKFTASGQAEPLAFQALKWKDGAFTAIESN